MELRKVIDDLEDIRDGGERRESRERVEVYVSGFDHDYRINGIELVEEQDENGQKKKYVAINVSEYE